MTSAIIAVVAIASVLASCSSTNDPVTPSVENSFVVNGSGYTDARFIGDAGDTASIAGGADGKGAITISGTTPTSGERFAITLVTRSSATGTYPIGITSGSGMTMLVTNGSAMTSYLATSGTIMISEWNVGGRVKGTFSGSFVVSASPMTTALEVTAGTFDAKLVD